MQRSRGQKNEDATSFWCLESPSCSGRLRHWLHITHVEEHSTESLNGVCRLGLVPPAQFQLFFFPRGTGKNGGLLVSPSAPRMR